MNIAFFLIEDNQRASLEQAFGGHQLFIYREGLNKKNIREVAKADIIVSRPLGMELVFDATTLDKFPNLKFICTMSTGFDHIDLDYCNQRGIVVSNIPSYAEDSVAEQTFALLLSISRKIPQSLASMHQKSFDQQLLRGFELKNKTIGVIGSGKIGLAVIRIAQGFGMHVLVYDVVFNEAAQKKLGFSYVELDELIKKSNIISLHAPLTKQTHHLLNDNLKKMKRGGVIINTARAELIDSEVLIELLNSGQIFFAGLDVFEKDYLGSLLETKKVFITLHNVANTVEAKELVLRETIKTVRSFLDKRVNNVVNL